jgi:Mrp family chromosome partitioning ATPase
LDTAPFQATSDAAILSSVVGGILIVVRAEHTNIELLNRKLREYHNIEESILGLVLNMVKVDAQKERYQYSYYNY